MVWAESPLEMSGPTRFNTCIRAGTNHKATSSKTSKKSKVPRTAMTVVLLSSLGWELQAQGLRSSAISLSVSLSLSHVRLGRNLNRALKTWKPCNKYQMEKPVPHCLPWATLHYKSQWHSLCEFYLGHFAKTRVLNTNEKRKVWEIDISLLCMWWKDPQILHLEYQGWGTEVNIRKEVQSFFRAFSGRPSTRHLGK